MKKGTQVSEKIPAANRQYKDTVFRMLFSEKENLLSLYNAVTGNAYQNADDLKRPGVYVRDEYLSLRAPVHVKS